MSRRDARVGRIAGIALVLVGPIVFLVARQRSPVPAASSRDGVSSAPEQAAALAHPPQPSTDRHGLIASVDAPNDVCAGETFVVRAMLSPGAEQADVRIGPTRSPAAVTVPRPGVNPLVV